MTNQQTKEQISQKITYILLKINNFIEAKNIHSFYYISFGIIIKKFLDISKKYKISVSIDNELLKQLYDKLGFISSTFEEIKNNEFESEQIENSNETEKLLKILKVLDMTYNSFENMNPQIMNEITFSLQEVAWNCK